MVCLKKKIVKNILLCAVFSGYTISICHAGNDNYPLGARSAGMATASVMLTDIWASANNQAGLGFLEQPAVALFYENRLNVKGLSLQAATFAIPVQSTTIALNYRHFGFSKYHESKFGLAIGKSFGEKFALGVQMDYFHTHFADDYGNVGILCAEIGLLCKPVKNLIVGAHLFNLTRSKQKVNFDEQMPVIMRLGIGYTIHDKAMINVETEKNLRMDAVFKGGLEYSPIDDFSLRCGISNGTMYQYCFGIGYRWKNLTLDISFAHHKFLGFSPHISLIARL